MTFSGENTLLKVERCCSKCNYYFYSVSKWGQPFPEYYCTIGHWNELSYQSDFQKLDTETDCKDFHHVVNMTA